MLTLWAVVKRYPLAAGVLGGLTLLTHPIAAAYVVVGSAVLWATRGADRRMLWSPLIALAIGALWFVPMIIRHGLDPLLAGLGSRDVDILDNAVLLLAETINPPNLAFVLGFVGAAVALQRRRWDLVIWLVVSAFGAAVVDRWVAIPLAVLAGLAVDAALVEPARLRSVATVVWPSSPRSPESRSPTVPKESRLSSGQSCPGRQRRPRLHDLRRDRVSN